MKINNLIALSGSVNSGKDLVGQMVLYIGDTDYPTYEGFIEFNNTVHLNNRYEIKKVAEKLKVITCILIGCTRNELEDEEFKNKPLGTEWERYELDTIYWADPFDASSNEHYDRIEHFNTEQEAIDQLAFDVEQHGADYYSGNITKEILTPRKILQMFGTQGGRDVVHPNIWVNSLFSDYKPIEKGSPHLLEHMDSLYFGMTCGYCNAKFSGYKRQPYCKTCSLDDKIQIYPKWVITDVRFPNNEALAVKDRGGLMIGIKRKFDLKQPKYFNMYNIDRGENEYSIPRALQSINPELYKSLTHESERAMGDYSWCDIIIENNGTIEELFNNVLKSVS
jgi:hypothetical protein